MRELDLSRIRTHCSFALSKEDIQQSSCVDDLHDVSGVVVCFLVSHRRESLATFSLQPRIAVPRRHRLSLSSPERRQLCPLRRNERQNRAPIVAGIGALLRPGRALQQGLRTADCRPVGDDGADFRSPPHL